MTEMLTAEPGSVPGEPAAKLEINTEALSMKASFGKDQGEESEVIPSHQSILPDISDLLSRPRHEQSRSPPRYKARGYHRKRVKGYKSNSLLSPINYTRPADQLVSQSNTSFSPQLQEKNREPTLVPPKTVRLKEMRDIYSTHLVIPRTQITPPHYSRKSFGSPRSKRRDMTPPRKPVSSLFPKDFDFPPFSSELSAPFPILPRPKGHKEINPLRLKHYSKSPKSPKLPSARSNHERSVTSIEGRGSPYDIRFVKPYLRKNFKLCVDVEGRTNSGQTGLVVKKATRKRDAGSQEKDRKVFKMLNSLL